MSVHLDRAHLLFGQHRFKESIEEIQHHFHESPEDAQAICLQALCLVELDQYKDALEAAHQAIHFAPDEPSCYYVLARVHFSKQKYPLAEKAIKEALAHNPYEADYYALLAAIHGSRNRWKEAEAAAEQALECDAENVFAANILSTALVKLGRDEEAGQTLDAALNRDPDNAHTHANKGWAHLHNGDHNKALDHFREALRLEPHNEWAREGVIQALQARHVLYRPILKYFLLMSRFDLSKQWAIIIGLYIVYRVIVKMAIDVPASRPITIPLGIAYLLFVYFSWTANSMFNILLRFNKFGRLVLSDQEKLASTLNAVCLLGALGVAGFALASGQYHWGWVTLGLMVYVIPISKSFSQPPGTKKTFKFAYTGVLAILGLLGTLGLALDHPDLAGIGLLYFIGVAIFTWIGNI